MGKVKKAKHHKKLLRQVIFFMLRNKESRVAIKEGHADFNYNFTNILAKYYNANDNCRISKEALKILKDNKVEIPGTVKKSKYSRETFRGGGGKKNIIKTTPLQKVKGEFMFDHNPPVNIIRKKILEVNNNEWNKTATENILGQYEDCVFMLTRKEDTEITKKGLNSKMPEDWKWGDKDEEIRYSKCSIEISGERMHFNTNKIPR